MLATFVAESDVGESHADVSFIKISWRHSGIVYHCTLAEGVLFVIWPALALFLRNSGMHDYQKNERSPSSQKHVCQLSPTVIPLNARFS